MGFTAVNAAKPKHDIVASPVPAPPAHEILQPEPILEPAVTETNNASPTAREEVGDSPTTSVHHNTEVTPISTSSQVAQILPKRKPGRPPKHKKKDLSFPSALVSSADVLPEQKASNRSEGLENFRLHTGNSPPGQNGSTTSVSVTPKNHSTTETTSRPEIQNSTDQSAQNPSTPNAQDSKSVADSPGGNNSPNATDDGTPVKVRKPPGPKPGWKKLLLSASNSGTVTPKKTRGRPRGRFVAESRRASKTNQESSSTPPRSTRDSNHSTPIGTPHKKEPGSSTKGKKNADASTTATGLGHFAAPFLHPQYKGRANPSFDMHTVTQRTDYTEPESRIHINGTQEVPTLRPTAKEFEDPASYVANVQHLGKIYGMLKIIPPSTWNPQFSLDTDVSIAGK